MAISTANPSSLPDEPPEQGRLDVLWEDEMKTVNKYVYHKHVVTLLLYWENKEGWTDMETEAEVDQLATVLGETYKFQVHKQMFHPNESRVQSQMNKYLSNFIFQFDGKDTLLIIYYAGHGWELPGGRGRLPLAAKTARRLTRKQKENRTIDWNNSEIIIQKTDAEILLILDFSEFGPSTRDYSESGAPTRDCCECGALTQPMFPARSGGRRFELLAACEYNETTQFPGEFSFTSALVWALKILAPEAPFSTCKLRQKITEAPDFAKVNKGQRPLLCPRIPPSNPASPVEHIFIEVLGQSTNHLKYNEEVHQEEDQQLGDYVDFRYHFKTSFNEDELRAAAKEMRGLIEDPDLSLQRITFIQWGNSRKTLAQVASIWRTYARRKKAAGSPSPLLSATDFKHQSSIGYHARELIKCIWVQWFDWLLWTIKLGIDYFNSLRERLHSVFLSCKPPSIHSAKMRLRRLLRTTPRRGYTRVEWICDCGEPLWGDFILTEGAISTRCPSGCERSAISNTFNSEASSYTSPASIEPAQSSTTVTGRSSGLQNTPLSHVTRPNRSYVPQTLGSPSAEKYLELCVNTGAHSISLAEIKIATNVQHITSDGQLFGEIRRQYQSIRRSSRPLYTYLFEPTKVNFVQFCLEDKVVGILKTPLALPSDSELASKHWQFCSCACPLKDPPPMPNNVFMHYLFAPESDHPRDNVMNRLPKKVHSSIFSEVTLSRHPGSLAVGWGIHIIEGPNPRAVYWLTVATCLISFVFALSWAVLKGDIPAAFAVGSFLIAFQSAVAFAFFNYYPVDQVVKSHQE